MVIKPRKICGLFFPNGDQNHVKKTFTRKSPDSASYYFFDLRKITSVL